MSHLTGKVGYIGLQRHLHPLPYLQGKRVEAEEEIVLRQGLVEAAKKKRQDIYPQFPGR